MVKKNARAHFTFEMKPFLHRVVLLVLSIVLFTLPQPNFLNNNGFPFLVFFALIPLFLLVRSVSWRTVWLYGFAYGFGCYCLYTYWLATFHPMGITVIASMYGLYLMLALPCLKLASCLYKKNGWLVQWVVWCCYEYVKTLGFSGFHYGVTGYSQWQNPLLLQFASFGGVWAVSALVTFPSAWISARIYESVKTGGCADSKRSPNQLNQQTQPQNGAFTYKIKPVLFDFLFLAKKHVLSAAIWCACLVFALSYGVLSRVDYTHAPAVTVALIQPNNDPWIGDVDAYGKNLDDLIALSDEALASNSEIDLVVWPETAFVPRIEWHYKYRQEREKFVLVEKLLHYFDNARVPFLTGNDHAVLGYSRLGVYEALDYNTAMLFTPKVNCIPPVAQKYMKMHLVPFTEYFPYEKQFPALYEALLNGDTHLWEPGTEPVVFEVSGLKFAVPICFEDTFGYIGRRFVNNGARAFVNISNDAWSKSMACQYQHLSMAVFRAAENHVPMVRATASGQTVIVDPNGKVLSMAEPFTKTMLVGKIPVLESDKKTLYTRYGDYVGKAFTILSFFLLAGGIIGAIRNRKRKK